MAGTARLSTHGPHLDRMPLSRRDRLVVVHFNSEGVLVQARLLTSGQCDRTADREGCRAACQQNAIILDESGIAASVQNRSAETVENRRSRVELSIGFELGDVDRVCRYAVVELQFVGSRTSIWQSDADSLAVRTRYFEFSNVGRTGANSCGCRAIDCAAIRRDGYNAGTQNDDRTKVASAWLAFGAPAVCATAGMAAEATAEIAVAATPRKNVFILVYSLFVVFSVPIRGQPATGPVGRVSIRPWPLSRTTE